MMETTSIAKLTTTVAAAALVCATFTSDAQAKPWWLKTGAGENDHGSVSAPQARSSVSRTGQAAFADDGGDTVDDIDDGGEDGEGFSEGFEGPDGIGDYDDTDDGLGDGLDDGDTPGEGALGEIDGDGSDDGGGDGDGESEEGNEGDS